MPVARRQPAQERSRRTVERILAAAAEVLADVGYDAASTNRIAAAAGVSPGTLYGYFNDKDDIVTAVIERVVSGFGDELTTALQAAAGHGVEDGARLVLGAVLASVEARAQAVEGLLNRIPADRYGPVVGALRDRVSDVVVHLVISRVPSADHAETRAAAWTAVRTIEQLAVNYAVERPAIAREAFVEQLTRMVLALAPAPLTAGQSR